METKMDPTNNPVIIWDLFSVLLMLCRVWTAAIVTSCFVSDAFCLQSGLQRVGHVISWTQVVYLTTLELLCLYVWDPCPAVSKTLFALYGIAYRAKTMRKHVKDQILKDATVYNWPITVFLMRSHWQRKNESFLPNLTHVSCSAS